MKTILITGATGTIGKATLRALAELPDVTVRAAVRPESFAKLPPAKNIVPVAFDFARASAFPAALAGVDHALLITPVAPNGDELARAFIDAAKAAGVRHVVKLSSAGADAEQPITLAALHRKAELALEASGVGYTHLRPVAFADNFVTYWPPHKDGTITLPFGEGRVAYVDAADVGAVAAAILREPSPHAGKAYMLTGPAAISTTEVAEILSTTTGRALRYVDVHEATARDAMTQLGLPDWMRDGFLELYAIAKQGWLSGTTDDVERILGRKPTSFASFAAAHRAAWS